VARTRSQRHRWWPGHRTEHHPADPGADIPRSWRKRSNMDADDSDFSDDEAGESQEDDDGEQPQP
jgi:hypothetical protein